MERQLIIYPTYILNAGEGKDVSKVLDAPNPETLGRNYAESVCKGTIPQEHSVFFMTDKDSRDRFNQAVADIYSGRRV